MNKRHRQLAAQHQELVRQNTELVSEAKEISERGEKEERLLGAEENTRVSAIINELDKLAPQIEAVEREMDAQQRLESFERVKILHSDRPGASLVPNEFTSLGELMQAVVVASDPTWRHRIGQSQADVLINKLQAYQAAGSGMSVGVPSDGGYLVRKDWSTAMLDRAREGAVLFPRTRQVPVGAEFDGLEYPFIDETSRATGSRWGGVQVYWKAEAATVTAKQPKIGKGELRLEEIMGLAYATERLLRDAGALESILTNSFESEFGFKIDDAILRGSGAGMPLGFFAAGGPFVSVAKEAGQAAATVKPENVTKMFARMPARLKAGAVWLVNPDVMPQLPLMVIGQQPVWLPPGNLTQAPNGLLFGKPVVEIEQAETLGTQGDIWFANMNEYVTITKASEGMRYDTSLHVRFLNDEMAFRWVFRINGQPTWKTALTPFKGSASMSPFVTLDTRA